ALLPYPTYRASPGGNGSRMVFCWKGSGSFFRSCVWFRFPEMTVRPEGFKPGVSDKKFIGYFVSTAGSGSPDGASSSNVQPANRPDSFPFSRWAENISHKARWDRALLKTATSSTKP